MQEELEASISAKKESVCWQERKKVRELALAGVWE
jgi:hypothetical protein